MSKHVKHKFVKVGFDKQTRAALDDLLRAEKERRRDADLGAATLLREWVEPIILARHAELKSEAGERRSGSDRRAEPVEV